MKACCRFHWREASFSTLFPFLRLIILLSSQYTMIPRQLVFLTEWLLCDEWRIPLRFTSFYFFFDLWIRFVALPRTLTHSNRQPPAPQRQMTLLTASLHFQLQNEKSTHESPWRRLRQLSRSLTTLMMFTAAEVEHTRRGEASDRLMLIFHCWTRVLRCNSNSLRVSSLWEHSPLQESCGTPLVAVRDLLSLLWRKTRMTRRFLRCCWCLMVTISLICRCHLSLPWLLRWCVDAVLAFCLTRWKAFVEPPPTMMVMSMLMRGKFAHEWNYTRQLRWLN